MCQGSLPAEHCSMSVKTALVAYLALLGRGVCHCRGIPQHHGCRGDTPEPPYDELDSIGMMKQLTSTTARALAPGCFSAIAFSERYSCVLADEASAGVVVYDPVGSMNNVEKLI